MAAQTAQTFIVIFPNYYGVGETIREAVKGAKKAGYWSRNNVRKPARVVALACPRGQVEVTGDIGVSILYPNDVVALEWEMDL